MKAKKQTAITVHMPPTPATSKGGFQPGLSNETTCLNLRLDDINCENLVVYRDDGVDGGKAVDKSDNVA